MDVSNAAEVEARVAAVRNLTAHAGGAFSLAMGAPIDSSRHKRLPPAHLVPATTRADAALAATAVSPVASGLLLAADSADYDGPSYDAHFAWVPEPNVSTVP